VREWLYRSDADHRDKLLGCALWSHYSGTSLHESMKVLEETKFMCSSGIAHNEVVLSKTCMYIGILLPRHCLTDFLVVSVSLVFDCF